MLEIEAGRGQRGSVSLTSFLPSLCLLGLFLPRLVLKGEHARAVRASGRYSLLYLCVRLAKESLFCVVQSASLVPSWIPE